MIVTTKAVKSPSTILRGIGYVGAVENRVLGEGVHFIIPFAEKVVQLEVRTLKFQADASAASNDLQEVQTTRWYWWSSVLSTTISPTGSYSE